MNNRIALGSIVAGALLLTMTAAATAEEARQQLNPSMILNMLARPLETPAAAFNARLKDDAQAPRPAPAPSNFSIVVRNPCPPGDLDHELASLRPLPGRGRR